MSASVETDGLLRVDSIVVGIFLNEAAIQHLVSTRYAGGGVGVGRRPHAVDGPSGCERGVHAEGDAAEQGKAR